MSTKINLPVQGLDYDEIKTNFIQFLKNDNYYSDYNFEGSGINALLNIFAYNTHYIGMYVKMMLGESFIDSATKRSSLMSMAKLNGYLPKNLRSARVSVILKTTMSPEQEPVSQTLTIPRGTSFRSKNVASDNRNFFILDSVICYDKEENEDGDYVYSSPEFEAVEGDYRSWRFLVNNTVANQRFIIKDNSIDVDTIRVTVYEDQTMIEGTAFQLASNLFEITENSNVFYVSTNEQGYYEIFFGNNLFGTQPAHNNVIFLNYIASSGTAGNGSSSLDYNKPNEDLITRQTTGSFDDFEVVMTFPVSFGGVDKEEIEQIRFNIPNHYRRQNRVVTSEDYRSVLLEEFRDIDSINVWGGEKNYYKDFGSVYVSVKPKYSKTLSGFAKEEIEKTLEKYGVVGTRIIVETPEYIDVNVDAYVQYNKLITNKSIGEIEETIISAITQFNTTELNTFDIGLSDVDLLAYIKELEPSISRIYTKKILNKTKSVIYSSNSENLILFGNQLVPNTITSSAITYAAKQCHIKDDGLGNLWLVDTANVNVISTKVGTIEYAAGVIKFVLNFNFTSLMNDDGISGDITFTATPEIPDINTYLNNIVNINVIRAFIS